MGQARTALALHSIPSLGRSPRSILFSRFRASLNILGSANCLGLGAYALNIWVMRLVSLLV